MSRVRDRGAASPAVTAAVAVASAALVVAGLGWARHDAGRPTPVTRTAPPSAVDRALTPGSPSPRSDRGGGPSRDTPARPRLLALPSVGATLPVVPVGVAADGQMEMPPDPADIGWYRFGPRPGAPRGSAVLAGHVDSVRYGVGPLARLSSLHPGDRLTVHTTTGPLGFRVVRVAVVAKSDVALREVFRRQGRPSLRIVTCGPPYIASLGGYQDNVIVTAVRTPATLH